MSLYFLLIQKSKKFNIRLSTYNKTDEHENKNVLKKKMNMLEPLIFKKLNTVNNLEKDLFFLKINLDFFINTIKNGFEYISS